MPSARPGHADAEPTAWQKIKKLFAPLAVVGVLLPFALGYAVCWSLGLKGDQAIVAGAALTATSVGITARVLADLGRLQDIESQIVLGAAVVDDIIGLIILTVVGGTSKDESMTWISILIATGKAFGFLIIVLVTGWLLVPPILRLVERRKLSSAVPVAAVILALALAWLAARGELRAFLYWTLENNAVYARNPIPGREVLGRAAASLLPFAVVIMAIRR